MEPGERVVMASLFKATCLALLDQVEETGMVVVVTKRGKPVARLVPLEAVKMKSTEESVILIASDDDEYFSTGEEWVAEERQ